MNKISFSAPTPPKHISESDGDVTYRNPEPLESKKLVKQVPMSSSNPKSVAINLIASVIVVAAGIGSGWGLSQVVAKRTTPSTEPTQVTDAKTVKVGDVYGAQELNGFRDSAEGVLLKGGLDGEGSHRLLRPGGKTQTVYLTSSVIDLDPLINHKVKVWGDTFAAQKANWLMDVGRVEVIELDSPKPFEEE